MKHLHSQREAFKTALAPKHNAAGERLFVVYAYLRQDGTPYYIGIASTFARPYAVKSHSRTAGRVPTDIRRVRLMRSGLNKEQACRWEMFYIKKFGRLDLGTGCLRNQTDGGEGKRSCPMTAKTKAALSASKTAETYEKIAKARMKAVAQKYEIALEDWRSLSARERSLVGKRYANGKRGSELLEQSMPRSERWKVEGGSFADKQRLAAARFGLELDVYNSMESKEKERLAQRFRRGKRGADLIAGLVAA